jgi:ABC-type multidrug transport system ATPase subunit
VPAPSPHPPFLELASVSAGYDRQQPIFRDLTIALSEPGLVRLAGPNGSGKSTLLELVSGFLLPFTGGVSVMGFPADGPDARHARSVCRTAPALYPSMTARDHLAFASRCRNVDLPPLLERAERYGLNGWLERATSELSTGNQRKLWLLACTAAPTPVLVLDEPFNGMDDHGVTTLTDELIEAAGSRLVILIAHAMPMNLQAHTTIKLSG